MACKPNLETVKAKNERIAVLEAELAMADAADALRKADKLQNYIQDPKTDDRMRYVYENYYMTEALAQARDALGRAKQILLERLTMARDALTT